MIYTEKPNVDIQTILIVALFFEIEMLKFIMITATAKGIKCNINIRTYESIFFVVISSGWIKMDKFICI